MSKTDAELMRGVVHNRVYGLVCDAIGRPLSEDETVAMNVAVKHSADFAYGTPTLAMDKIAKRAWKRKLGYAKDEVRMQLGFSFLGWLFLSAAIRKIVEMVFDHVWSNREAIQYMFTMEMRDAHGN